MLDRAIGSIRINAMKETEFTAIFESLTARQRKVIQHFLAEESDEAIAAVLYVEPSTVRRHLANICKEFGFSNTAGEHYSYRDELRNLFLHFRPEMMKPLVVSRQSQPLLDQNFRVAQWRSILPFTLTDRRLKNAVLERLKNRVPSFASARLNGWVKRLYCTVLWQREINWVIDRCA
jgi:hypothetical protein